MKLRIPPRRRDHGSAVVVIIVLLAIMLVYVLANLKALHYLNRELRLINQQQVQRWRSNPPKVINSETNTTRVPAQPTTAPAATPQANQ